MIASGIKQTNLTRFSYLLLACTAILMIVNVLMSARVAQDGLMIDTLSKRQTQLQADIRDLEQQLFSKTSLNDLSQQAETLGYTAPTSVISVTATAPLAFNQ